MSFNITPAEYLALAREEYDDFLREVGSIRRAMSSCILTNHIVDHVLACHYPAAPAKLRLPAGLNERDQQAQFHQQLATECPEAGLIRDVCDFGKHGPQLRRRSVMVEWTGIEQVHSGYVSRDAAQSSPMTVRRRALIILNDKREAYLEIALGTVLAYWEARFKVVPPEVV